MLSVPLLSLSFFFFNDTATTEIYTLSLHDAPPDRPRRPDHADSPRPRALHRRARARLDHADQRHRRALSQKVERLSADGVARDDQGLHPAREQIRQDLARVPAYRVRRLGAIRDACGVAEIDHRLVRQALEHRPRDGEPTDAGIEDAERSRVHGCGSGRLVPTPPGNARTFKSLG